MSRLIRSLIPAAFFALPVLYAPANATEDEVVDLTQYTCKDIMRMSDENRAISLSVLHGYRLGVKGEKDFVSADLSMLSNDFIEYCLDNPHEKAMASFEKIAK